MEEWLFDLTDPTYSTGTIVTVTGSRVVTDIARRLAEEVVAAHNKEWKKSCGDAEQDLYWLILRDLGEGYSEPDSIVVGDPDTVDQYIHSLTDGTKYKLRIRTMVPKRIHSGDLERIQVLFKEMRQHESDAQRYTGLASKAREELKALGAPLA
jgi:hypothetical protein